MEGAMVEAATEKEAMVTGMEDGREAAMEAATVEVRAVAARAAAMEAGGRVAVEGPDGPFSTAILRASN